MSIESKDYFSTIEIEINHACNMSCSYCPNSVTERMEKGHMSRPLFELIITQLQEIGFKGVMSFSFYNEPTLSSCLNEFIEIACAQLQGVFIKLYSNGSLLTIDRFQSLKKSGVGQFVITKHENVENFIFQNAFDQLSHDEKKSVVLQSYKDLNLTNRGGVLKHITSERDLNFLPCHIPNKMLTITLEGNVIPCFEDFHQVNSMGNVKEQTIKQIWNSKKYIDFRNQLKMGMRHKNKVCKNCNRFEVL